MSTSSTATRTSRCSPFRALARERASSVSPMGSCRRGCTAASGPWPPRRCWCAAPGWHMSRRSARSRAPASRSTSGALPGLRASRRSLSTEKDHEHMAADPSYPDDLLYHSEHDWARVEGEEATFGVTWYAQDALGEVVFFDPPKVGTQLRKDEPYTEIESVKAVSDVIAPMSGEVIAVNDALGDAPETINSDPY